MTTRYLLISFLTLLAAVGVVSGCTDCTAGGTGASSCSISQGGGCSVSCNSGYYACCSVTGGCRCCQGGGGSPLASHARTVPVEERTYSGNVTVTTPGEGLWTFVTVSAAAGQPLAAALALQYGAQPTADQLALSGKGRVVVAANAVTVLMEDTRVFLFKLSSEKGRVPSRAVVVPVIGVAYYPPPPVSAFPGMTSKPATEDKFPTTHEGFVAQRLVAAACDRQ